MHTHLYCKYQKHLYSYYKDMFDHKIWYHKAYLIVQVFIRLKVAYV